MKYFFIFAGGITIGWLCSQVLPNAGSQKLSSKSGSEVNNNINRRLAEAEMRLRENGRASNAIKDEQTSFDARLKAALGKPATVASSNQQKFPNDRFTVWLESVTLSQQLEDTIHMQFEDRLEAGDEDPLSTGSPFDLWLRERLNLEALASWTAHQNAHTADKVERRANQLLVGLQSSLSLTPAQKDSIYPRLVEWAQENTRNVLDDNDHDFTTQEKSISARMNELSALIPAEQHEALEKWLEEFLPSYWLEESDSVSNR